MIASGGWIGSYSSLEVAKHQLRPGNLAFTYVASFPAYFRMILLPPAVSDLAEWGNASAC